MMEGLSEAKKVSKRDRERENVVEGQIYRSGFDCQLLTCYNLPRLGKSVTAKGISVLNMCARRVGWLLGSHFVLIVLL